MRVDLQDPAFKANPYPTYAQLRATDAVHHVDLPDRRGFWLVTRYSDVVGILRDSRFVKDYRNARTPTHIAHMAPTPEIVRMLDQHMLAQDPPVHTRLRALVQSAFTPRLVAQLTPRIQAVASALVDAVQARGELDVVGDYAFPLSITIIGELLSVPTDDRVRFRAWSSVIVENDRRPAAVDRLADTLHEFDAYLQTLFDARRRMPGADLVTGLVHAQHAGDRLSQAELFAMVVLLLVAGHETTVNLIGNAVLALLQHPRQLARLRSEPELIEAAVEELLRYDGPVATSTSRYAAEDVEVGGQLIPRGSMVLVVLGSANRDETQFSDPDRLDIARQGANTHLAFGHGVHYCLGAPLARLECQIAIATLLRRLPGVRLNTAPEALAWRPGILMRGVQQLTVAFDTVDEPRPL